MGYNTALIILNDGIDQLLSDPDAGKKIYQGIMHAHREPVSIGIGYHANMAMVLPPRHADEDQLVLVGGNYIRAVDRAFHMPHSVTEAQLQEAVIRHLAMKLGYSLRKR